MLKSRWLCLLCALALLVGAVTPAQATEDGRLLTPNDLKALQPAWERFLGELADLIIAKGLLEPSERERWMLAQLGDYTQNGGYGMIAAMYTPDLLDWVRPQDQMLVLTCEVGKNTLTVRTMSAYDPTDRTNPGLWLEAALSSSDGLPVACRIRWGCSQGGFLIYDAVSGKLVDTGNRLFNDGRPAYWSDQPPTQSESGLRDITLEILDPGDESLILGSATLTLAPQDNGWVLSDGALVNTPSVP